MKNQYGEDIPSELELLAKTQGISEFWLNTKGAKGVARYDNSKLALVPNYALGRGTISVSEKDCIIYYFEIVDGKGEGNYALCSKKEADWFIGPGRYLDVPRFSEEAVHIPGDLLPWSRLGNI